MTNVDEKEQQKIISFVQTAKDNSETNTLTHRTTWLEMWRLYNSYRTTGRRTLSKVISGMPFAFVESASSSLFNQLQQLEPSGIMEVQPADSKTKMENAFNMKVKINNDFHNNNGKRKMLDFINQGLVIGTTAGQCSVKRNTKYIPGTDDKGKETEEEKTETCPNMSPLDMFEVFFTPMAQSYDFQDLEWIIIEKWIPYSYFKQRENLFINVDKIQQEEHTQEWWGFKGRQEETGNIRRVRYWEFWGEYTFKGKTREYVIGITQRNNLVRFERNPYQHQKKPFISSVNFPCAFSPYGKGEFEPIKNMIYQSEDLTNAAQDNINNLVHCMWTVLTSSPLYTSGETHIYSEAGKIIPITRDNELNPLVQGRNDISSSVGFMLNNLKSDAQWAVGVSDIAMGMSPRRKEAVGTVYAMQQAVAQKYAKKMFLLLMDAGRQMAEFFGSYNQQYANVILSENQEFPYSGALPDGMEGTDIGKGMFSVPIGLDGLEGKFIYTFNVDPMRLQAEVMRQQLQSLYMFVVKSQVTGVSQSELLRMILYTYPIRNLDKIMKKAMFAPNELMEALQTLIEGGYKIIDPKGRELGQPQSGQNGGRPEEGAINENKLPAATSPEGVVAGVQQGGQLNRPSTGG